MVDESRNVANIAPGFVRPKDEGSTDKLEGFIAFSEGSIKVGDLLNRVQGFRGQDGNNGEGNPQNFTEEDKSWLKSTIDKLISIFTGNVNGNTRPQVANSDISNEDKNWVKSLIDKLLDFFLKMFGKKEQNPVTDNQPLMLKLSTEPAENKPVVKPKPADSDQDKNWIKQLINRLLGLLLGMTGKGKSVQTNNTRPVRIEDSSPVALKDDNQNTIGQFTDEDKNWIKGLITKLMNFLFGSKPPQQSADSTSPTVTIVSVTTTNNSTNPVT